MRGPGRDGKAPRGNVEVWGPTPSGRRAKFQGIAGEGQRGQRRDVCHGRESIGGRDQEGNARSHQRESLANTPARLIARGSTAIKHICLTRGGGQSSRRYQSGNPDRAQRRGGAIMNCRPGQQGHKTPEIRPHASR